MIQRQLHITGCTSGALVAVKEIKTKKYITLVLISEDFHLFFYTDKNIFAIFNVE